MASIFLCAEYQIIQFVFVIREHGLGGKWNHMTVVIGKSLSLIYACISIWGSLLWF